MRLDLKICKNHQRTLQAAVAEQAETQQSKPIMCGHIRKAWTGELLLDLKKRARLCNDIDA
jgi:hypothetical protein